MTEARLEQLADVTVEFIRKKKSTRINIICDGKEICLSNERTSSINYLGYLVTDKYIVAYLTNVNDGEESLRVTGLFDRVTKNMIQVTKANRDIIKHTLISKASFYLSTVLEYLNHGNINAASEEECKEFEIYLTSSREFQRSEIEEWIFKSYPKLRPHTGMTSALKFEDYLKILQEVGSEDLYFHAMPVNF